MASGELPSAGTGKHGEKQVSQVAVRRDWTESRLRLRDVPGGSSVSSGPWLQAGGDHGHGARGVIWGQ